MKVYFDLTTGKHSLASLMIHSPSSSMLITEVNQCLEKCSNLLDDSRDDC